MDNECIPHCLLSGLVKNIRGHYGISLNMIAILIFYCGRQNFRVGIDTRILKSWDPAIDR